ncbi:hypothetical protein [uncultured Alistipes sp.]|uniref:hypothetical protein n=1 Tax=uncultured Alistipes sp. TaxID=538949 RepID=UPI0025CD5C00|nr:hypothetical protein [uncultured Alistipes sp.]
MERKTFSVVFFCRKTKVIRKGKAASCSTGFRQIGTISAKMILEKSLAKVERHFRMIRRNTF